MNDATLLLGSLSNDLLRIASLKQRGSNVGAQRFLDEAKRWAAPIYKSPLKAYIKKIAEDVLNTSQSDLTIDKAEDFLMYGILLQNYTLHNK